MRLRILVSAVMFSFLLPAALHAQDFAVMESAETIDRGNFKFKVNPLNVFGRDGGEDEPGVVWMVGYGVTNYFDLEGGVALYDGVTIFGGTAEVWLVRNPLNVSAIGGLHFHRGDNTADITGVDFTLLASKHLTPRFELYGALDTAFESFDNNGSFRTVHFVPGVEVKLGEDVDFVAEVGLAVNDDARHYISGGLAFYVR
jgi:opacity protein-like surface antigen